MISKGTSSQNHGKTLELANNKQLSRSVPTSARAASQVQRPQNILFYIRKSDDADEILDLMQETISYIKEKLGSSTSASQRTHYLYMERWALDCLEERME